MADELDTFMTQLSTAWEAVTGIKDAPEHPLEGLAEFPIVISYFVRGRFIYGPAAFGIHTVHSDVLLGRTVLPEDEAQARPFILRWLTAVAANVTMSGSCEHCHLTDYEYGRLEYNEQASFFGVRFVHEVKVQHRGITVSA